MAVSEERRTENDADPRLIARRARRFAREIARREARMAVSELQGTAPPPSLQGWQVRVYEAEIERLLSRI